VPIKYTAAAQLLDSSELRFQRLRPFELTIWHGHVFREIRIMDDGSIDAVDHGLMRLRFFRGLVLNGRTEVVRADTGERLGRTDVYVGMNIDLNGTIENLDVAIASLTEIRTTRAAPHA
jgi:hypothetical protein